jgi:hypothetical protein
MEWVTVKRAKVNSYTKAQAEVAIQSLNDEGTVPTYTSAKFDSNQSFGAEVNLVGIVREHAPKRIAEINKHLAAYEKKMQVLGNERKQLIALVDALEKVGA